MHRPGRTVPGGCPGCATRSRVSLIGRSVMSLAAFGAERLAAREHMVRTDPGSLSSARVARTGGERQPASRPLNYRPSARLERIRTASAPTTNPAADDVHVMVADGG